MNAVLLQRLLNLEGFGLKVDGKIGRDTRIALQSLPEAKRQQIELEASSSSGGDIVSGAVVRPIVTAVAKNENVPESYLVLALEHEFAPALGKKNVAVPNSGKYIGIGQFDATSWRACMPDHPYSDALDPKLAVVAIARYYKLNKIEMSRRAPDLPFNDRVAYLAHNQGVRGAVEMITGRRPIDEGQSAPARALAQELRRQYGPQNRRLS